MKSIASSALFLLSLAASLPAVAGTWNTDGDNVAIGGYDVVAYHTADRAVRGSAKYAVTYDGAIFRFSTEENAQAFSAEPQKYLPAFGGYCAFGVASQGAKAPTDPETFKIYNGHLLLFFNDLYEGKKFNTKIPWNQDEEKLFAAAQAKWATID